MPGEDQRYDDQPDRQQARNSRDAEERREAQPSWNTEPPPEQAKVDETKEEGPHAEPKGWSVKEQTITDAHTGLTIRFGSYGDASNSVFMQVSVAGVPAKGAHPDDPHPPARGSTLVFQRGGEVIRVLPHVVERKSVRHEPAPAPEKFVHNPGATLVQGSGENQSQRSGAGLGPSGQGHPLGEQLTQAQEPASK